MVPVTVQRPPVRADTGAIPSSVRRGLQFLNLNRMKTQAGNALEQVQSELPWMEQERGLALPAWRWRLFPLLAALEGTAQSTVPRLGG